MEKIFYRSLLCLFIILVSMRCSKDKTEDTPSSPIVGFWVGHYTVGSSSYTNYYAVLFKSNGTLREYRGDPISGGVDTTSSMKNDGSYTFSSPEVTYTTTRIGGVDVRLSYSGVILDPQNTHIEGTWGIGTSTINQGTFMINKQ